MNAGDSNRDFLVFCNVVFFNICNEITKKEE